MFDVSGNNAYLSEVRSDVTRFCNTFNRRNYTVTEEHNIILTNGARIEGIR